jgi:hypothetical protein
MNFKARTHAVVLSTEFARRSGLKKEQGRIARGNARRKALAMLRSLRDMIDTAYPSMASRRSRSRASSSPQGKAARAKKLRASLQSAGFIPLRDVWPLAGKRIDELTKNCAMAGVRMRKGPDGSPWVPSWAVTAKSVGEMQRAKKDRMLRESLRTLFIVALAQRYHTTPMHNVDQYTRDRVADLAFAIQNGTVKEAANR